MSVVEKYFSGLPDEWKEVARQQENDLAGNSEPEIIRRLAHSPVNPIPGDDLHTYDTLIREHDLSALGEVGIHGPDEMVAHALEQGGLEEVAEMMKDSPGRLRDKLLEVYGPGSHLEVGIAMEMLRDMFLADKLSGPERATALRRINTFLNAEGIATGRVPDVIADSDVTNRAKDIRESIITGITRLIPAGPAVLGGVPRRAGGKIDLGFMSEVLDRYASADMFTLEQLNAIREWKRGIAAGRGMPRSTKREAREAVRTVLMNNNAELVRRALSENLEDVNTADNFIHAIHGPAVRGRRRLPEGRAADLAPSLEEGTRLARNYITSKIRRSLAHASAMSNTGLSAEEQKEIQTAVDASTLHMDVADMLAKVQAIPDAVGTRANPMWVNFKRGLADNVRDINAREGRIQAIEDTIRREHERDEIPDEKVEETREEDIRAIQNEIIALKMESALILNKMGGPASGISRQNVKRRLKSDIKEMHKISSDIKRELNNPHSQSVRRRLIEVNRRLGRDMTLDQAKRELRQLSSGGREQITKLLDHKPLIRELDRGLKHRDRGLDMRHSFRALEQIARREGIRLDPAGGQNQWRRQLKQGLIRQRNQGVAQKIAATPTFMETKEEDISPDLVRLIQDKPKYVGPGWIRSKFQANELPIGNKYGKVRVFVKRGNRLVEIDPKTMKPGVEYYVETKNEQIVKQFLKDNSRDKIESLRMPRSKTALEDLEDSRNRKMNDDELENLGGALSLVPVLPDNEDEVVMDYEEERLPYHHERDPFNDHMRKFSHAMASYLPKPAPRGEFKVDIDRALRRIGLEEEHDPMSLMKHFQNPKVRYYDHPLLDLPGVRAAADAKTKIHHDVIMGAHNLGAGLFSDIYNHTVDDTRIPHPNAPIRFKADGGGLFDDIGRSIRNTAGGIGNRIIHEGNKVLDAEKKYWHGFIKRVGKIAEDNDVQGFIDKPSLVGAAKVGRGVLDVAREEVDAIKNDPLFGVPITLAASVSLPELGSIKGGLDVVSMAAHGDFDGSLTHALSLMAEEEAKANIPGLAEAETAVEVGKKIMP